ncbi:unnamed protein product [Polarella glacialis]|uniref:CSD domain-containing protein n=1 Tax=Polarella glacialis TaxID=89957 RepID=A0A813KUU1_POLGL|nr:unnamed protein product [Polarella glacialis]
MPPVAEAERFPPRRDSKLPSSGGEVLQGQIRSWKEDWGFIVAPEHFDGDLFVHKGSLQDAEALTSGVFVDFEVGTDTKGRRTAFNVRVASEPQDWVGTGTRLQGQIRSWKHPWGFLVSPGSFVGDLFYHMGQLTLPLSPEMIQPGFQVSFVIEEDKVKGRATAKDIHLAAPAPAKRGLPGPPPPPPGPSKRPRL